MTSENAAYPFEKAQQMNRCQVEVAMGGADHAHWEKSWHSMIRYMDLESL